MEKLFTLREVEAFAAVIRQGTVTKAADALDLSQPAVSKLLAEFQRKAGFVVFRKLRQRLVPTAEAQILYSEVERSFVSIRDLARVAADIRDLRAGRFSVAALPGVGLKLLPTILTEFLKSHPDLAVTCNVRSSSTILDWVARGQVDLGIAVSGLFDNPAVVRRALPAIEAVCVLPVDHRLAARRQIEAGDLDGEPFISLGPSDPLRRQLDELCETLAVRRRMLIDSPIASVAMNFVTQGAGVSVIDFLTAAAHASPEIVLRRFKPELQIELCLYRPRSVVASAVTEAFTEHFVKWVERELRGISVL